MFRFDFQSPTENSERQNENTINENEDNNLVFEVEEISPDKENLSKLTSNKDIVKHYKIGNISISYLNILNVPDINGTSILKANQKNSDLIPGVYEEVKDLKLFTKGGAKIWECTDDLLKFLFQNSTDYPLNGKRVIDLGCGIGLLGIYALQCGATVCFQDYNKDVLQSLTIPSVKRNFSQLNIFTKSKFISGDWGKFAEKENDNKYDVIITSETVYNPKNYFKLIKVFKKKLEYGGYILLAGKVHYFGVGGGLRQFENVLVADKTFDCKQIWQTELGMGREILLIKHK